MPVTELSDLVPERWVVSSRLNSVRTEGGRVWSRAGSAGVWAWGGGGFSGDCHLHEHGSRVTWGPYLSCATAGS